MLHPLSPSTDSLPHLAPHYHLRQVGLYGDRNLSGSVAVLHRLPLLPLPVHTGLRPPTHASHLADVALQLAKQLITSGLDPARSESILVGGDSELRHTDMIRALQQSLPQCDAARGCHLLPIPNRLFFLLASPLLLRSPKAFEAVLRMSVDLSGFTPAHQLLGETPQPFPVMPLAR